MFDLKGRHGQATIFADFAEDSATTQVLSILDQPYAARNQIRGMPNLCVGPSGLRGLTMTIRGQVCPNLVGSDIGCGIETARLKEERISLKKLDQVIRDEIPAGNRVRDTQNYRYSMCLELADLFCAGHIDINRTYLGIGALGGGGHFIEVARDEQGYLYLIIHTGSHTLGQAITRYYQARAYNALTAYTKDERKALKQEFRAAGRKEEYRSAMKELGAKPTPIPKDLVYAEGELLQKYLYDMTIAQLYAELNRQAILDAIVKKMKLHVEDQFSTVHNYIDMSILMLRNGAVSARAGERLLIPISMQDGSLLCTGRGNPDWNYSAPCGVGNLAGRTAADVEEIIAELAPTVRVDAVLHPVYTFTAGASTIFPKIGRAGSQIRRSYVPRQSARPLAHSLCREDARGVPVPDKR